MPKLFVRIFRITAVTLGAAFLLLSVFFASLQTQSVRQKIQEMTISYAKENGLDLSMQSIEGTLPFSWTIHDIALKWGVEDSLKIKKARIRFDFFAFFRRALSIDVLALDDIQLAYTENPDELTLEEIGNMFSNCASLPWNIRIKTLKAPDLKLENLTTQKRAAFSARASLLIKNKGKTFSFMLKAHERLSSENSIGFSVQGVRGQVASSLNLNITHMQAFRPLMQAQFEGNFNVAIKMK